MVTNRMSYVVFYQGKHVLNALEKANVNITYVSKKQSYAVIYTDVPNEASIKKQLRSVKGFKHFGPSHLFDTTLNF